VRAYSYVLVDSVIGVSVGSCSINGRRGGRCRCGISRVIGSGTLKGPTGGWGGRRLFSAVICVVGVGGKCYIWVRMRRVTRIVVPLCKLYNRTSQKFSSKIEQICTEPKKLDIFCYNLSNLGVNSVLYRAHSF
jgi:hypothetical protein